MAEASEFIDDGGSLKVVKLAMTSVGSFFLALWTVQIEFVIGIRDGVTKVLSHQANAWETFVSVLYGGIPEAISNSWDAVGAQAAGLGPFAFAGMVVVVLVGVYGIEQLVRRVI